MDSSDSPHTPAAHTSNRRVGFDSVDDGLVTTVGPRDVKLIGLAFAAVGGVALFLSVDFNDRTFAPKLFAFSVLMIMLAAWPIVIPMPQGTIRLHSETAQPVRDGRPTNWWQTGFALMIPFSAVGAIAATWYLMSFGPMAR